MRNSGKIHVFANKVQFTLPSTLQLFHTAEKGVVETPSQRPARMLVTAGIKMFCHRNNIFITFTL